MTPEELDDEIARAAEGLLDLIVQAKFATYRAGTVPPVLKALRGDGSTLQIYGPEGYSVGQEFEVLECVLRIARAWMPDHTVLGFDSYRMLDPSRAPAEADRSEATLFESTMTWDGASPVILVHGYNGRDGVTGELVDYVFKSEGEMGINEQRLAIDGAWLSWSAVATNMERFLLPGFVEMDGFSFEDEASEAHSHGYSIFAVQHREVDIFVQAWGETYLELSLKPGLSRAQIERGIAAVFAMSRAAATEAGEGES